MNPHILIYMLQKALILLLLLSAVPVLSSLITGLIVSLFQSVTQIQEPTLSFVPKFIAVSLSLLIMGPMIAGELVKFSLFLIQYTAFVQ
jgi:flagellar biosynthesis protein FliQ